MPFLPNEKILVANRGEICLHICRAARELSIPTIALYAYEDRYFDHYRVEHTVTEQILDIDLVQAQTLIARGAPLCEIGKEYMNGTPIARGVAIQSRVISENNWMDSSRVAGVTTHSQRPRGPGIWIDGYNLFPGAEVTPHYNPLLFKCIVHAKTLDAAAAKMLAALSNTHVDGVETNVDLLQRILQDSRFLDQEFLTRSLDNDLLLTKVEDNRSNDTHQKLVSFFAETLINGTQVQGQIGGLLAKHYSSSTSSSLSALMNKLAPSSHAMRAAMTADVRPNHTQPSSMPATDRPLKAGPKTLRNMMLSISPAPQIDCTAPPVRLMSNPLVQLPREISNRPSISTNSAGLRVTTGGTDDRYCVEPITCPGRPADGYGDSARDEGD